MAKTKVEVELTHAQEIALMNRFGRKCSRETLVKRALAEVLKMQADDIPIFIGTEEATARFNAEAEAKRLAAIEAAKLPPEVFALLERFKAGEKFVDEAGREVSALEPNEDLDTKELAPVVIQVDRENSEWFPVALDEIVPFVKESESSNA